MAATLTRRFVLVIGFLALVGTFCATPLARGQESSLLHQTPQQTTRTRPQPLYGQTAGGNRNSATLRRNDASAVALRPPSSGDLAARSGVYDDGTPVAPPPGPNVTAPPRSNALAEVSWMHRSTLPPRQLRLNDIITIRVDELAQARAEGAAENRKNSLYDAVLKDWISLSGGFLKPSPQSDGDPRVNGQLNSLYRSDAAIESRESLTFNIAARVVDIRPNGHLVVEAHKTIWVNDNAFETSLTGICRADDIGPDNVLLSRDLLNPQIRKTERGSLRDGYRRGWFQRWFEEFQLF